MQEFSTLDGAILIDKPSGPTSHDVVDAIRPQRKPLRQRDKIFAAKYGTIWYF
jgi:tRNA U55 pseudouridine synthase TruB